MSAFVPENSHESIQINDFSNKKYLCQSHSHNDNEYSPQVSWTPIEGAKSYALILEDPDASPRPRNFIHWYIPYISRDINQIDEINITRNHKVVDNINKLELSNNQLILFNNQLTNNNKVQIIMGKNSLGNIGYHGPCAPKDSGVHRYIIKLYGLKEKIPLDDLSIKSSEEFEIKFKKNIIKSYTKTYYYKYNGIMFQKPRFPH
jgi:Raf kinase inhibitor-like YbhB/YbcL family protein